ncbi:hypothetical protein F5879DRAFT_926447 [Lentinula edodes]|nr:hypothetical protein F5879DRAFT_926447 [Lentinula edodes]
MADEIVKQVELLGLLLAMQFGAHPGRNTTDSIHLMVDRIKELWREGYLVAVLYMDVKGAFPSVNLEKLYHQLRAIAIQCPGWRRPRGPFSAIGYILYAAGLLQLFKKEEQEEGFGFMDDVAAMKWGHNIEELHKEIRGMLTREDNTQMGRGTQLQIQSQQIQAGSLMDKQLWWKEQQALTVKRVKSGMAAQHIQQLYKAKALPRMLYAVDITLVPHTKKWGKTWKDEKGQAIL